MGETRVQELGAGGAARRVTAANKIEYVRRLCAWHLDESVESQFERFRHGFERVVGHGSALLRVAGGANEADEAAQEGRGGAGGRREHEEG